MILGCTDAASLCHQLIRTSWSTVMWFASLSQMTSAAVSEGPHACGRRDIAAPEQSEQHGHFPRRNDPSTGQFQPTFTTISQWRCGALASIQHAATSKINKLRTQLCTTWTVQPCAGSATASPPVGTNTSICNHGQNLPAQLPERAHSTTVISRRRYPH